MTRGPQIALLPVKTKFFKIWHVKILGSNPPADSLDFFLYRSFLASQCPVWPVTRDLCQKAGNALKKEPSDVYALKLRQQKKVAIHVFIGMASINMNVQFLLHWGVAYCWFLWDILVDPKTKYWIRCLSLVPDVGIFLLRD